MDKTVFVNMSGLVVRLLMLQWMCTRCYVVSSTADDKKHLISNETIDSCGNTYIVENDARKRIVGGSPLLQAEWPWLVSLHEIDAEDFKHACGASLIHPEWILTAAHCLIDPKISYPNKNNWRVILGEHVQDREEGTEQKHTLDKIVIHRKYLQSSSSSWDRTFFDIALLKLSRPADMSEYVNTICIEPDYTAPDHSHCVTAGWGHLVEGGDKGSEIPLHASVQIVPNSVCAKRYRIPKNKREAFVSVMCAATKGRDACQGDSGGPLACFHDGHWTQVGVVNSGGGCANPLFPGIYTRVNHFYDWIANVINSN